MGRFTGGCERASEHLWSLGNVHCGRARMYRLPLCDRRVRHSHLFSASRPHKGIELVVIPSSDNSLRRIKALLFTLVRGFEFELALPADDIVRMTTGVGHPVIASNPAAGPQLPLLIRPANMN